MKNIDVVLIPGDGIGPEVCDAVRHIFEKAGAPINWIESQAGLSVIDQHPTGLPQETVELMKRYRLGLKGPTTTPAGRGHRSVNVLLRKQLGLYANVRPSRNLPGIETRYDNVNLTVVRENIEDTYSGIEYIQSPTVAWGIKLATQVGAEQVIRYAFEFSRKQAKKKLTCIHKANIHKFTDGLFLKSFERIRKEYPEIESNDILVDNACMQIVRNPEQFEVLVTPNLYGDIISDLLAGLVGGLGVAPAGNIGNGIAVFEAVHGSAPDIAGQGLANPTALLLSSLMLLRHLGLNSYADAIEGGLISALKSGARTKDIGGELSTAEFARAVVERLPNEISHETDSSGHLPEELPLSLSIPNVTAECSAIDVYIRSAKYPENAPKELPGFELEKVFNRGTEVTGKEDPIKLSDVYSLRYKVLRAEFNTAKLISALEELGCEWISLIKVEDFSPVA